MCLSVQNFLKSYFSSEAIHRMWSWATDCRLRVLALLKISILKLKFDINIWLRKSFSDWQLPYRINFKLFCIKTTCSPFTLLFSGLINQQMLISYSSSTCLGVCNHHTMVLNLFLIYNLGQMFKNTKPWTVAPEILI